MKGEVGQKDRKSILSDINLGTLTSAELEGPCPHAPWKRARSGVSGSQCEQPSSALGLAGLAALPLLPREQLILCKEHWTLPTVFLTPCRICPLSTVVGGAQSVTWSRRQLAMLWRGGRLLFACGHPDTTPPHTSVHMSLLSLQDPRVLTTALFLLLFPSPPSLPPTSPFLLQSSFSLKSLSQH